MFFSCRGDAETEKVLAELQTEEDAALTETDDEKYSLRGILDGAMYPSGECRTNNSEGENVLKSAKVWDANPSTTRSKLICRASVHF